MKKIYEHYFDKDVRPLRQLVPDDLAAYLDLHWQGQYARAFDQEVCLSDLSEEIAALYLADRCVVAMKLGKDLTLPDAGAVSKYSAAHIVYQYAVFSKYFWIDHKRSYQAIFTMMRLGLRFPGRGISALALFLMGHLLTIGNRGYIGFWIGYLVFRIFRTFGRESRFANSIVYACFPYTCFLAKRFSVLTKITFECEKSVPSESYYQTIFIASQLYAFAYAGDMVRSEIVAIKMMNLVNRHNLPRYKTLARLLALLPVAFKGYIKNSLQEFESLIDAHDETSFDPLINSQFFRAAAVICLTLNEYDRSRTFIAKAIDYRKKTRSFGAWDMFDQTVLSSAQDEIFDFNLLQLYSKKSLYQHDMAFGAFMIQLIEIVPKASEKSFDFASKCCSIICSYLGMDRFELREEPPHFIGDNIAQAKIGDRFAIFESNSAAKVQHGIAFLEASLPTLKVVESVVRRLREAQEENEQMVRDSAIARTAEMFAHDALKPFSTLDIFFKMLKGATNFSQFDSLREKFVPFIESSVANFHNMSRDLLDLHKVSLSSEMTFCDPEDLLKASVSEAFIQNQYPGVHVSTSFQHQDFPVFVDFRCIVRVLVNILHNAAQVTHGQCKIQLRTRKNEALKVVDMEIENSNSSIPKKDLPVIFLPSYSKRSGGHGLGLAIAKRIVTDHRGSISCQSNEQSVCFKISLPVGDEYNQVQ